MSEKKVALVTGASSGIGKEVAVQLAAKGYTVYAAARRMDKLEEIRSANIEPLSLDLTDSESITAAAGHIKVAQGRLDVLINNAGYGQFASVEGAPMADVRQMFEVNLFGVGHLTQELLPMMRQQGSGSIVNVSSVAGKIALPIMTWYASSKFALEGMTDGLRQEVSQFGINVVLVEPGFVNTGFEAVSNQSRNNDPSDYDWLKKGLAKVYADGFKSATSAEAAAAVIVRAAEASRPRLRYRVGRDAKMVLTLQNLFSARLLDRTTAFNLRMNAR